MLILLIPASMEESHAGAERVRHVHGAIEATLVRELRLNVLLGRVLNQVGEELSLLLLAIEA
jgi:hypothetical protein